MTKNDLAVFKEVLIEAGKVFNRPPYEVNRDQWTYLASGKSSSKLVKLFGYTKLRDAVCPSPDATKEAASEARKMIERLLKNT